MSTKYSGGLITKNPVTPAGPYETGAAPGVWTVEQALQYTKQGIWPTQGNVPNYIEDVFSTYLFNTSASNQNIINGINLATYGGLTWIKSRSNVFDHVLQTSAGSVNNVLSSNSTSAALSGYYRIADLSNGFTFGTDYYTGTVQTTCSWTFRKQPKFFDVVTYTGDSTAGRTISHNLGSVPGCIIIKSTSLAGTNWAVYHRSLASTDVLILNGTNAAFAAAYFNSTAPTSTVFSVGSSGSVNNSGDTYVAYLFAHNAGGFGLTGTDNVISCGSFTTNGSGNVSQVSLGYEPQWVLYKTTDVADNWRIVDSMRGMPVTAPTGEPVLKPNTSAAEQADAGVVVPNATGFSINGASPSFTYIYIAIRRGPMKVPTVGTTVFTPATITTSGPFPFAVTSGFPVDSAWYGQRNGWLVNFVLSDRLRGAKNILLTTSTNSESTNNSTYGPSDARLDSNTQFFGSTNVNEPSIYWMMRRAPSFFDEVCYTGTGTGGQTYTHNLGVVPELMIVKSRSLSGQQWPVYASPITVSYVLQLNTTIAATLYNDYWAGVSPTSSVFSVGPESAVNQSGATYVAYLFATCAGVSKVGSYTGTGATQTINCGFGAGGSRFVLIKRTDTTGDWYVWDSARGMVSGTNPSLLLNTTAAEVNANSIYTISTGFQIVSTAAGINASGGSYIFLSIA